MFVTFEVAKDVLRELPPIVEALKRHSADLADQLDRAATSVALNLAEGNWRTGKDRRRFFVMAHGSAREMRAVLDIIELRRFNIDTSNVCRILDRELGLLYGLVYGSVNDRVRTTSSSS